MANKARILSIAKKAGKIIIQNALTLYYTLNSDAPNRVKVIIAMVLAYLVAPIDSIPDLIPVLGFSDDLGLLITVLSKIAIHIKDESRQQARQDVDRIFDQNPS
ncbi:hypothetical protein CMK18_08210 [Candidatus Poribacteria bacterium]|nr:hypothetical protein [Candidatus Poribacteria bacterium]